MQKGFLQVDLLVIFSNRTCWFWFHNCFRFARDLTLFSMFHENDNIYILQSTDKYLQAKICRPRLSLKYQTKMANQSNYFTHHSTDLGKIQAEAYDLNCVTL